MKKIVIFLILALLILLSPGCKTKIANAEETKCIGEKSYLFISNNSQSYRQILVFENVNDLNIIDCDMAPYDCNEIKKYPTWIINNKVYEGYHSLNSLKKLTNC